MEIPVLLEPLPGGGFRARSVDPLYRPDSAMDCGAMRVLLAV